MNNPEPLLLLEPDRKLNLLHESKIYRIFLKCIVHTLEIFMPTFNVIEDTNGFNCKKHRYGFQVTRQTASNAPPQNPPLNMQQLHEHLFKKKGARFQSNPKPRQGT